MLGFAIGAGAITLLLIAAVALAMTLNMAQQNLRDAQLKITRALPNGAATVFAAPGIDTQKGTTGQNAGVEEWILKAPAMNTTEMPDAKTMIYSILMDTVEPIDGSSVILMPNVITQTGAGGAGCAAAEYRFRLPSDAQKLISFKAVGSAAGNATTASATLEVLV